MEPMAETEGLRLWAVAEHWPSGERVWTGAARSALGALDAWADSLEMARYSDCLSLPEGEGLVGELEPDGSRWAIHTNYTVWAVPASPLALPVFDPKAGWGVPPAVGTSGDWLSDGCESAERAAVLAWHAYAEEDRRELGEAEVAAGLSLDAVSALLGLVGWALDEGHAAVGLGQPDWYEVYTGHDDGEALLLKAAAVLGGASRRARQERADVEAARAIDRERSGE